VHFTEWRVQNPAREIHDHHQGCQKTHIIQCDSNPSSSRLIILEPHKILHWGSLFCWFSPFFANQYAQEWVHLARNLSSHDKNCIKPTLGQFYFMRSINVNSWKYGAMQRKWCMS